METDDAGSHEADDAGDHEEDDAGDRDADEVWAEMVRHAAQVAGMDAQAMPAW